MEGAVRVKVEPAGHEDEHERGQASEAAPCPEDGDAGAKEEDVVVKEEAVRVKQELYSDHEVREGLVLGPVCLQERVVRSEAKVTVKLEPGSVAEADVKEGGSETEDQTQHSGRRSWPTLTIEPVAGPLAAPRAPRPRAPRPPAACHVCCKQFKEPNKLKEHMRAHTGEKPYPCKTCDKRFARRSILKVHERTHTGEKPFCCKICNKRLVDARSLKTHDLIHARNPYPCDACDRNFADPDTLRKHKLFHLSKETEYYM